MAHHMWRRALGVTAGTAALTLGVATTASAHHCYKVDWNERAYANHAAGNTPWQPLSVLGADVIANDVGLPQCASYADVAVRHWMDVTGTESEPLIHTRATVGGGAHDRNGKTVKPFAYLEDADFVILGDGIGMAIDECMADMG